MDAYPFGDEPENAVNAVTATSSSQYLNAFPIPAPIIPTPIPPPFEVRDPLPPCTPQGGLWPWDVDISKMQPKPPKSLLDLASQETAETSQVCRITRAKEFLNAEQLADLEQAFKHPKITGAAIARTLWELVGDKMREKYGIEDIKPKTAQRHRRGECGCAKAS